MHWLLSAWNAAQSKEVVELLEMNKIFVIFYLINSIVVTSKNSCFRDSKTNSKTLKTLKMSQSASLLTLSHLPVNKHLLCEYLIRERCMEAITYCRLANSDFFLTLQISDLNS